MSQLSKAQWQTNHGGTSGTFADNTTRDISEGDMRGVMTDLKDSAMFISDNFIDEDSFASDSATKAPSQQSVKAYVTAVAGGITVGTSTITSGTSTRIAFNDGGVYGEDSAFTWDKTNNSLNVNSIRIHNAGAATSNFYAGSGAGNLSNTGSNNIGIGIDALSALTNGVQNVVIGSAAANGVVTGDLNTAVGYVSMQGLLGGDRNSGFGAGSLSGVTSGSNNTGLGQFAGSNITTGSGNIVIGARSTSAQSATTDDQLTIQNAIFGLSNSATGTTVSTGFIGIYQPAPTYQLHITGHSANQNLFLVEENGGANILEIKESAGVTQIGFFAATPVAKQAGLTAITHTAPGTPDYAIQDLVAATGFGFVTKDEGNTVLSVIKAMHDAMKNYGLLT